nr:hypothetical protein [Tanacetum cinerariifolium]
MHNNIMAAGLTNRPPMLAIGRYPQWRSRFLRYIDIRPNGDALRKCILNVLEDTIVETPMNMSPGNKAHFESDKEAIHMILTGIREEIYSTVDACQTAQEMWEAIKRLQQGKTLPILKLGCILSQDLLGFVSRLGCVLSQDLLRFVSRLSCVLSQDFLRFVSRPPAFCLKTWLHFVPRPHAFCLKTWLRFVSRLPVFCLKSYCILSEGLLRFAYF